MINPLACPGNQFTSTSCSNSRGYIFNNQSSSTWEQKGIYELAVWPLESYLGLEGNGVYGFDTVTLGWPPGSNLSVRTHQAVASIVTTDFWIGSLGLNPRLLNFTTLENGYPSLLASLQNATNDSSAIPSTSWAYTAGSYNLEPKIYGSLTLGGYDTTRFVSNNITFPFGIDQSYDFRLGVQDIFVNSGVYTSLLSQPHYTFINTLTPYIWLPNATCQLFETQFGLTWDNTTNLYLVNDTLHSSLLQRDPTVYFKVGPSTTGDSVTIALPYSSLYLQASYPLVSNSSGTLRYFPIKRTTNSTQYIFGRAFLQSAYMVADYGTSLSSSSSRLIR